MAAADTSDMRAAMATCLTHATQGSPEAFLSGDGATAPPRITEPESGMVTMIARQEFTRGHLRFTLEMVETPDVFNAGAAEVTRGWFCTVDAVGDTLSEPTPEDLGAALADVTGLDPVLFEVTQDADDDGAYARFAHDGCSPAGGLLSVAVEYGRAGPVAGWNMMASRTHDADTCD